MQKNRYSNNNHGEEPSGNIPAQHHDFKVGDKVTCLKVNNNHVNRLPKMSDSLPPDVIGRTDGHSTDNSSVASDRFFSVASEGKQSSRPARKSGASTKTITVADELSASSGNASPRTKRLKHPHGSITPNGNGSRNHSPRPANKDNGEARLRPGVTARAVGSNRNSANLSNSTLQEDLMKLINVDYQSEKEEAQLMNSNGRVSAGRSRERIAFRQVKHSLLPFQESGLSAVGKIHTSSSNGSIGIAGPSEHNRAGLTVLPAENKKWEEPENSSEVILTTARPATVISNASTASSPAPSEMKMSKEERWVFRPAAKSDQV